MCGRYVSVKSDEDLTLEFGVEEVVGEPLPSWNVAPTNDVRIVARRKPHGHSDDPEANPVVQLRTARWGLIPSWTRPPASPEKGLVPACAKDPKIGDRLIDARVETLASIIWGQPVESPIEPGCRFLAREGRPLAGRKARAEAVLVIRGR
jgi:putative SOS response-associated peptidase YedK